MVEDIVMRIRVILCSCFCVSVIISNISFLCFKKIHSGSFSTIPNDTNVNDQWAIQKVELDKAWDIYTGSSDVRVGIIDAGICATHNDLSPNVDTTLGAHFGSYNINHLVDTGGHGTHVAGIVGAKGNNNLGVSGACWDVDLVSLSVAGAMGSYYFPGLNDAIQYASNSNTYIPIMNASFGGTTNFINNEGFNAIEIISSFNTLMPNYSGLLVCSPGNDSVNIGSFTNYIFPASYSQTNMIVVGNSDDDDLKHISSNYSATKVDLFAPGTDIYSTFPSNGYSSQTGTSMSSPLVAGTAALLKSIDPTLSTSDLKSAILNNVDVVSGLSNYCSTSGRLNAYKAALSILPEIVQNDSPISFVSSINYQKFMKMNCGQGHYSLSVNMDSPYRVTIYKKYTGTPLAQHTFTNGGLGTINFVSLINQLVFIRIENLGVSDCSASVDLDFEAHSYFDHYSYHNASYHKSYCSCGSYVLMPHVVQVSEPLPAYGTCVVCSAIVPINSNFNIQFEPEEDIIELYKGLNIDFVQSFECMEGNI